MDIRFVINKLGAIKDSKFKFKPLLIFTGDSGLGKSYSAFLAYYFVSFFTNSKGLREFVEERLKKEKISMDKNKEGVIFTFRTEDLKRYINYLAPKFLGYLVGYEGFEADVSIDFDIPLDVITVCYRTGEISIDGTKSMPLIIYYIENSPISINVMSEMNDVNLLTYLILKRFFLVNIFSKESDFQTMFLPPARGSIMVAGTDAMNAIMRIGMYKEFVNDLDYLQSFSLPNNRRSIILIESLKKILGGYLVNEKGNIFLVLNSKDKIPLSAAASSVKELSPLFLLLQKYSPNKLSVLFEEPEAHVHPFVQYQVADVIARCVQKKSFFQITTHSDYFLERINTLIKLYKIRSHNLNLHTDIVDRASIPSQLMLDPKLVGAYLLDRRSDGSVEIINQDVENGVPFTTFSRALDLSYNMSSELNDIIEKF